MYTVTWLAIAAGGAIGAMARHGLNHVIHARWATRFPAGIVAVNVLGCFVIGLLAGLIASDRLGMREYWREFVFVGVLGGFTTFSTFGLDTLVLARSHSAVYAVANVAAQVGGGLIAVWAGYQLGGRGSL